MNNLLEKFEKKQIENLTLKKRIPAFRPGDTIKVTLKITEGDKSRLQSFEGMCIARKNNSVNSKFTLRKISHGEGVERVFPLFSANIDKLEVIRKGNVKRAKLYYLRDRTGKSARIADRDRGDEVDQYAMTEEEVISEDSSKETSIETKQTESIEQNTEPKVEEEQIKKEASEQPVHEEKKENAQKESVKSEAPAEETEKKTDEQSK
ncbi:50S ribosomal protein L19 [Alphaproteobacteria bacterium]|nr:50S ribosomal protein L19 [Alphaproteobacteria bacterium]